VGCSIAYYLPRLEHNHLLIRAAKYFPVTGFIFILISLFAITEKSYFPGFWALLPVAGSALIILSINKKSAFYSLLTSKALIYIGRISFPLYLYHWVFLSFFYILLGQPSTNSKLVLIWLSFLFSAATYHFLEKPLKSINSPRKPLLLILLLGITGLISYFFIALHGLPGRYPNYERVLSQFSLPWMVEQDCVSKYPFTVNAFCIQSKPTHPAEALIFGDSFAHALGNGLVNPFEAKLNPEPVLVTGKAGCMPYILVEEINSYAPHFNCQNNLSALFSYIKNSHDLKTVYLVGRHPARVGRTGGFGPSEPSHWDVRYEISINGKNIQTTPEAALNYGLSNTIALLTSMNKKVVFVHSVPELNFNPRDCLKFDPVKRRVLSDCSISRHLVEERQSTYRKEVASILNKYPQVQTFDPLNYLCNQDECFAQLEGKMLYRDNTHLSADGASFLLLKLGLLNYEN
jgi:SGNH domain (fused to AT3 domains)